MNDGLKQRIVGALVLVALAIIFVPVIFDKERIVPVDRTSQIPLEPNIEALPLPDLPKPPNPREPQVVQPIAGSFDIKEPDEQDSLAEGHADVVDKPISSPGPLIERGEDGVIAAVWVLKVASYKSEDRAKRLKNELIAAGYKSFISEVKTSSGPMSRLYIGPSINKKSLLKSKVDIDKKYNIESLLLKFEP